MLFRPLVLRLLPCIALVLAVLLESGGAVQSKGQVKSNLRQLEGLDGKFYRDGEKTQNWLDAFRNAAWTGSNNYNHGGIVGAGMSSRVVGSEKEDKEWDFTNTDVDSFWTHSGG